MNKRKIYILMMTIVCAVLSSCEKELDFKYHEIDPLLVIEGSLT